MQRRSLLTSLPALLAASLAVPQVAQAEPFTSKVPRRDFPAREGNLATYPVRWLDPDANPHKLARQLLKSTGEPHSVLRVHCPDGPIHCVLPSARIKADLPFYQLVWTTP
jgi:hypothetical protein